jgi:hypothetical protein
VFNTILDPGWRGYATLELINHGPSPLIILAGDPIAQVVCHLLTEPTTQPYAGKYQDQEAGPQPARDGAISNIPIEEMDWPGERYVDVRIVNALRESGIKTVGDLILKTEIELLHCRNIGKRSLQGIKNTFGSDEPLARVMTEEIDAARIEALVAVLKDALPQLVTIAFTRFKAELPRLVPGLSDAEWETLVREEDQRRERSHARPS